MQQAEFHSFATALVDAQAAVPAGLSAAGGATLQDRFAIHRNNVHVSLVEALADNFPITRSLVGSEFFDAMARAYVEDHKPAHAQLHEYGSTLPEFISEFAPACDLPYLADVARLEIAWCQSWAAAEASALSLAAIAAHPPTALLQARVALHPATRLLRSPWPIGSIWQAHQTPNPDLSAVAWQAECVLVTRPEAVIAIHQLSTEMAVFADALMIQHMQVEQAAQTTITIFPDFDVGGALRALLEWGTITEVVPS
jgi:hypothetical protein